MEPSRIDPEEHAREYLERLRPMFEAMVGQEATDQILAGHVENVRKFMDSPRTWRAELDELLKGGSVVGDELLGRLLPHIGELATVADDLRGERHEKDREFLSEHPGAQALADHILEAVRVDGPAAAELLGEWSSGDPLAKVLEATPGLGRMLDAGLTDPSAVNFEEHVSIMANQVAHLSERWYRVNLICALKVTRVLRGISGPVPAELGKVMFRCREEWADESLQSLLDDRVRIIRNSEAHRRTEIDVRRKTVTFVNQGRETQRLGPLGREEFGEVVGEFVQLCLATDAALRAHLEV